MSVTTEENN